MRFSEGPDALGGASSSKDEGEGVLKNSFLSNLTRDEAGEDSEGFFESGGARGGHHFT